MKNCSASRLSGFTLIELLVVVLIIGILSAVALPQYQKEVARSRLAGMITLATSIVQAERVYHMANGEYTADAGNLDVQLPGDFARTHEQANFSKYESAHLTVDLYENLGGLPRVVVSSKQIPPLVIMSFEPEAHYYYCSVKKADPQVELGQSICATYGTLLNDDGGYYFHYKLK